MSTEPGSTQEAEQLWIEAHEDLGRGDYANAVRGLARCYEILLALDDPRVHEVHQRWTEIHQLYAEEAARLAAGTETAVVGDDGAALTADVLPADPGSDAASAAALDPVADAATDDPAAALVGFANADGTAPPPAGAAAAATDATFSSVFAEPAAFAAANAGASPAAITDALSGALADATPGLGFEGAVVGVPDVGTADPADPAAGPPGPDGPEDIHASPTLVPGPATAAPPMAPGEAPVGMMSLDIDIDIVALAASTPPSTAVADFLPDVLPDPGQAARANFGPSSPVPTLSEPPGPVGANADADVDAARMLEEFGAATLSSVELVDLPVLEPISTGNYEGLPRAASAVRDDLPVLEPIATGSHDPPLLGSAALDAIGPMAAVDSGSFMPATEPPSAGVGVGDSAADVGAPLPLPQEGVRAEAAVVSAPSPVAPTESAFVDAAAVATPSPVAAAFDDSPTERSLIDPAWLATPPASVASFDDAPTERAFIDASSFAAPPPSLTLAPSDLRSESTAGSLADEELPLLLAEDLAPLVDDVPSSFDEPAPTLVDRRDAAPPAPPIESSTAESASPTTASVAVVDAPDAAGIPPMASAQEWAPSTAAAMAVAPSPDEPLPFDPPTLVDGATVPPSAVEPAQARALSSAAADFEEPPTAQDLPIAAFLPAAEPEIPAAAEPAVPEPTSGAASPTGAPRVSEDVAFLEELLQRVRVNRRAA